MLGTRLRLGLVFLAPLGAVAAVLWLAFPDRMNAAARDWAQQRTNAITEVLANAAGPALEFEDAAHAEEILATLTGDREVLGAVLRRQDGSELAHFPAAHPLHAALATHDPSQRYLVVEAPVAAPGGTRGEVAVVFSRDTLVRQERENRMVVGLVALVTLVLGAIFSLVTSSFLARRKHAERELARSERNLRTLIDASPDAMVVHRAGQPLFSNPAASLLLGADLAGAAEHGLLVDAASPMREVKLSSRGGASVIVETRPLALFDGAPAFLTIVRDQSEKRRLEQQLLLADRMASVGTLAAGVAHEINNPLAYVLASLDFTEHELGRRADEGLAEVIEALADARTGAERVRDIVRDLKTFSRTDDEKTFAVDLHAALDVAAQMTATTVRHRGQLVKRYGTLPLVVGNESRFGQVFVNLLVNAAQALPQKGGQIEVATRTNAQGDAVITVSDNGTGIRPEVLDRIFDPFFTTKPVGEGTGLGLSICHSIIGGAGGTMDVRSTIGAGTTFTIVLPAAACAPAAEVDEEALTPAPRDARILVVDDEPLVLSAVQRTLGRRVQVITTTSARAALARLLAGEHFDVILCDLMMPEMSGAQLHEELVRHDAPQLGRMVFLTGTVSADSRAFLEKAGCPHMDKPFDPDALRRLVNDMVAGGA